MAKSLVTPTNVERTFGDDEIIVSKTDTAGRITYVNGLFLKVSDYTESEVLGQPHSMIRHPQMPRTVFKLLWDSIRDGKEIFAYVRNMAKNGDHYWVIAHVTPTLEAGGGIAGFHSNRRKPTRDALAIIEPLYRKILDEEERHADRKDGLKAGHDLLSSILNDKGLSYEQFVHAI
jgi:PAS domain S-box-containing protein